MPDIALSDELGKPVPNVKIDLSQPSSLLKYAKAELLHLAVVPDFVDRASQKLTTAAPSPISFQLKLQHKFQLGNTKPEINLTPSFQATIRANTTKGSNLFANDPFKVASLVPGQTGYVSLALQGSLDLGVSGSSGDLTFGFDANRSVVLEYWKAFPLGPAEPTLGQATGETISRFVIPADVDDLNLLGENDICCASGQGSLKISGGFNVSAVPNPLASVDLPLNAGKLEVKTGLMAGITASFAITGSYQIRARRISPDAIELSLNKQEGTTFKVDLSASGGVAMKVGGDDLLKSLLGAISTDPNDTSTKKLLEEGGLSKDEISTLTGAIKDSLDHSLQASLDFALSQIADNQAAFQYEIRPAQFDAAASAAVHKALDGDLSLLTALEAENTGAVLAPGVKLISSVLTAVRKTPTALKVNLLGLVNIVSLSDLIRKSVVVKDPSTGYLTISDSVTGNRINAVVEPQRRREALRRAMFESLVVTIAYRVSNTISMTGITSHNFHFAFNDSTNSQQLTDYLNWFVVMNLLAKQQADEYLRQFPGGGPSTCLIRTDLHDHACESIFFKSPGQLWDRDHYVEIGRQAMRALINPDNSRADRLRCELLDLHWAGAVQTGPNVNLGPLAGLHPSDLGDRAITSSLVGDVYTIFWWATTMQTAGEAVLEMRRYLLGTNPPTLANSNEFANRRNKLQKQMAASIGESRTRYDEPWGLITLFWASGSIGAAARLTARGLALQKPN